MHIKTIYQNNIAYLGFNILMLLKRQHKTERNDFITTD